jgi:hypothetical protein
MKEAGWTIKHMETEPTFILMEPNMTESGKMISNTVTVWNHGQMVRDTKETMKMERNMDRELYISWMEVSTKESSNLTKSMGMENTNGQTVKPTMEIGSKTRCTDKDS